MIAYPELRLITGLDRYRRDSLGHKKPREANELAGLWAYLGLPETGLPTISCSTYRIQPDECSYADE